jgi:hypothetical protein
MPIPGPDGRSGVARFSLAGIPRWQPAGRRGVLAVTTTARSSAILHSKKRPLCKGSDMMQARTTQPPREEHQ